MNENKKIKEVLLTVTKKAGASLKKDFYNLKRSQIKLKGEKDLVTTADLKSEKIVINAIKKNFPEHVILSEEAGLNQKTSDYMWVIDPLDGTTNFSYHNPIWNVSIAVTHKGKVIMGAVYIPLQDELFFAELNKGAYLNNKKFKAAKATNKNIDAYCHGSGARNINKMLKYYNYQKKNALDCRQLGSAAYELAYTALGRIDSILIPGANSWDVAAGALIVREAGGKVTDFKNKQWNIESQDILAANPKAHARIMKIVKKIKI